MVDWMINALKWSVVGLGIFIVFMAGFYSVYFIYKDYKFKKMIDKHNNKKKD